MHIFNEIVEKEEKEDKVTRLFQEIQIQTNKKCRKEKGGGGWRKEDKNEEKE